MTDGMKVSISGGNIKMGSIPSISLPPIKTCSADCPCYAECYARRMMNYRPSCEEAWNRNLHIYETDKKAYFSQVEAACYATRYFRWHVGGDIVDRAYLDGMVKVAKNQKNCNFLAFTKRYKIVNEYLNEGKKLPKNLKIILSDWRDWKPENPYNLPESVVIFKDTVVDDKWKICGGNCTECAHKGVGCWKIKNGEVVAFHKH